MMDIEDKERESETHVSQRREIRQNNRLLKLSRNKWWS